LNIKKKDEIMKHNFDIYIYVNVIYINIHHSFNTGYCLSKPHSGDASQPVLAQCDINNVGQKWIMRSKFKWQAS